jgi:hypothetical protein
LFAAELARVQVTAVGALNSGEFSYIVRNAAWTGTADFEQTDLPGRTGDPGNAANRRDDLGTSSYGVLTALCGPA